MEVALSYADARTDTEIVTLSTGPASAATTFRKGSRWGGTLVQVFDEGRVGADPSRMMFATEIEFEESPRTPVYLGTQTARETDFWLANRLIYATQDHDLKTEDVRALANEQQNRRRLALEKAYALQAMTTSLDTRARREKISQDVKVAV